MPAYSWQTSNRIHCFIPQGPFPNSSCLTGSISVYLLIIIISHMPCLICPPFSSQHFFWMIGFLTSPERREFLLSMTQPEISNCLIFNLLKAKPCSRRLWANGIRLDNPWSLLEMGEILFCSSLGWLSLHVMVKQAVLWAIYPNQSPSGGKVCLNHLRLTEMWQLPIF